MSKKDFMRDGMLEETLPFMGQKNNILDIILLG